MKDEKRGHIESFFADLFQFDRKAEKDDQVGNTMIEEITSFKWSWDFLRKREKAKAPQHQVNGPAANVHKRLNLLSFYQFNNLLKRRKPTYNIVMMITKLLLPFLILMSTTANARLFLNVSMTNKKGIDIGLTLGSELHSIEEVHHSEEIAVKMKSGIQVVLSATFKEFGKDSDGIYGPSDEVIVRGKIIGSDGVVLKSFDKDALIIPLEQERKVTHSQESQLVEVKIKPHLR